MATYRVVVDDTDTSRISYASGWNNNQNWDHGLMGDDNTFISGPSLFEGQHSTSQNNSLTFKFSGSSVEVYGYNDPFPIDGTSDQYDPKWTCFVDGNPIPPFIVPPIEGNNVKLCENANLDDGDHILEVRVVSRGAFFSIDRITYTPTSSVNKADILWVNATDPAFSFTDASDAVDGSKFTNLKGATMSYKFTGTKLMWFGPVLGDLPHEPATISYSIDGGRPKSVSLAGLLLNAPSNPNETLSNQLFLSTEQLSLQPHTITATYNGFYETPFALAYVYIFNATFQPILPTHTSQVSSPSSSATSNVGQKGRLPINAIIGGAVSALMVVAILLCLFLWQCRRQRRRLAKSKPNLLEDDHAADQISPFIVSVPSALQTLRGPFGKRNPNLPSFRPLSLRPAHNQHDVSSDETVDGPAAGMGGSNTAGSMCKNQIPAQLAVEPIQHQDSGLRLPTIRESILVVELPPQYTAV